jgi:hypothetical protein
MTKKHFIALADALRNLEPAYADGIMRDAQPDVLWQHAQWEMTVVALAQFCQAQNPAFKKDRWIAYINGECGPNGGAVKGLGKGGK